MINRLLVDLDKTVKIQHDNTEVKQSNVVLKQQFHSVALRPELLSTKLRNSERAGNSNSGN